MSMQVKEAMSTHLVTIDPKSSIKDAAKRMIKYGISGLLVTTAGFELKGIITEKDLIKSFAGGGKPDVEVSKVMSKKIITIGEKEDLEDAAKKMVQHHVKRLPVMDKYNEKCVGIITASDLMRYEEHLVERLSVLFLTQKTNVGGG